MQSIARALTAPIGCLPWLLIDARLSLMKEAANSFSVQPKQDAPRTFKKRKGDFVPQPLNSVAPTASIRQMVLIAALSTVASSVFASTFLVFLLLGQPFAFLNLLGAALFGYVAVVHFRRLIAKAERK